MDMNEKALQCHKEWNGKLETIAKSKVNSREDLAIACTPGVAEPCKVIAEDKTAAYTYTWKANTVAVVSDGKLNFAACCGANAVKAGANAGTLCKQVSAICGGNGGGRPDSAMSGGKDLSKIDEALSAAESILASMLN